MLMKEIFIAAFFLLILNVHAQEKTINLNQWDGETIVLPYAENDIVIKYVGIYYDAPKLIQYQYKLEGLHEDWQQVGNERTARFNDLDAGDYTFFVKAANPDGVWSKDASKVVFKILKPWYWTWWAKLIYFCIFSLFIYFIYRSEHYRKLSKKESERLEKLIQEAKNKKDTSPLSDDDPKPRPSADDLFLDDIRSCVEAHLDDSAYSVEALAKDMNMSRQQLYRKTKALTGKSIASYVRLIRLHHGKQLLRTTTLNVSEVAYQVGFTDPSYFSKSFSEEFGYSPNKERAGQN